MLQQNPIYNIYKQGKIPIIRYKNDGFKNYNQNDYFKSSNEDIPESCKDIIGCFCLIGGMQDSFILSGVENSDNLWIGYVEPDTIVFSAPEQKYLPAKEILDKAMGVYEGILKETTHDEKERCLDSCVDDFDIFFTQAIVNADDIEVFKMYEPAEFKELWHTIHDDFFKVMCGLDFFQIAKNNGQLVEFVEFINDNGLLRNLLAQIYNSKDCPEILKQTYPCIDTYCKALDNVPRYEGKYLLHKKAPIDLNCDYTYLNELAEILHNTDIYTIDYSEKIQLYVNNKLENCKFSINDGKINIKTIKDNRQIDVSQIYWNRYNISVLSNLLCQINKLAPYDEMAVINDIWNKKICNAHEFLENHEVLMTDCGFEYHEKGYSIEYDYILDDCVIVNYYNDEYDKSLHEEDIILKYSDDISILDTVKEFRKLMNFNEELEQNIR